MQKIDAGLVGQGIRECTYIYIYIGFRASRVGTREYV